MSRRTRAAHRKAHGDPRFGNPTISRFVNNLMVDGKKSVAEGIMYDAMDIVADRSGQPADQVFEQAISNTKPSLEVKSRRVGGATYQVPMEVHPDRRVALAIKWLISFARRRGEKTMAERLAGELLDASRNEGSTVKKKEETHRMAEANKAFAHYRW